MRGKEFIPILNHCSQDDDDDDDFFSGNFEMELAQMETGEGSEKLLGDGPENQQTNVKWVSAGIQCFFIAANASSTANNKIVLPE